VRNFWTPLKGGLNEERAKGMGNLPEKGGSERVDQKLRERRM